MNTLSPPRPPIKEHWVRARVDETLLEETFQIVAGLKITASEYLRQALQEKNQRTLEER